MNAVDEGERDLIGAVLGDLLSIQSEVNARFAQRQSLEGCINGSRSNELNVTSSKPKRARAAPASSAAEGGAGASPEGVSAEAEPADGSPESRGGAGGRASADDAEGVGGAAEGEGVGGDQAPATSASSPEGGEAQGGSGGGGGDGGDGGDDDEETDSDTNWLFKQCMEHVGLSWNRWHRAKEELAICWCEQKWSDLVTTRLTRQVAEACAEHGQLLRRLQLQQASIFDRVVRLHSDSLWQLDRATAHIMKLKHDELASRRERERERELHASEVAALRAQIVELQQHEQDIEAGATRAASEKVDRMSATLSTMRDLYQDLRSNAASLNAFDLKDTVSRLEVKLSGAIGELEELRLLRDEAQSAKVNFMVTKVELQTKRSTIERQKLDLKKRGKLVHELMMSKGELAAELESRDAVTEEAKAGDGNEGEVGDVQPPDDVEEYAQNASSAILDQSVLCVRCDRSLHHLTELTNRLAIERQKRVACLGYRMLLPALKPKTVPPERSHGWGLGCMRAILLAKVIDRQLHPDVLSGFPEFVHAFYAPLIIPMLTDKEKKRLALMVQQGIKVEEEQDISQHDLDRWSLYAKVKALSAIGSVEAKLFWLLLDEVS